MDKIAAILAIADPTVRDQPAVAKAAILAARCSARLELLVCDTGASSPAADAAAPASVDAQHLLEGLAAPLRARGLDVSTHVSAGGPLYEKLLERTRHAPVDLVIKDTHRHSLATRSVIASTDRHLIRGCQQPLWLAKSRPWADRPVLIAAIDPGHAADPQALMDQRILEHAAAIGACLDAEVHVAHAYLPAGAALRTENERQRAGIAALAEKCGIRAHRVHVEAGIPGEFLPRVARDCGADVVVIGAIARGALQQILIGSTAERVLDLLPCDVLIVKPLNFAVALPF